ncbi:MAG: S41 family peptidase [Prevotella sp.]|nr:S41 family peptidase [Prevotella sp.]
MNLNKTNRLMPLALATCVVLGILIGTFYSNHFSGNRLSIINSGSNRLNDLLHLIDDQYVDSVNMNELVENAIPEILAELDPHSVYISAKDVQSANDELQGSFSGVGIEFVIRKDTIHVQNVIPGGPAESAGLIAGDKIVSVDDKPFVGKEVTNEEAMRRLKGPRGTKVRIGVVRHRQNKVKQFTVTRDNITTKSISCAYMLDSRTGYIRIKNFGENTYGEMIDALTELSQQDFENLVIDLRDNAGGYMSSAIQIADEFLPKNSRIVYTEGRKQPRQDFMSTGHGSFQNVPLVVLINEGSASASEILAGAIQDNDRGTVIGRRSFGKGLVQQQIGLRDGSMIRLTIARYYSPSGRCIQKHYNTGNDKEYEEDLLTRYNRGEYFSMDSIKHEGPEYHTRLGRTVYGGGGITPDIFVPEDTTGITSYYKEAAMSGLILQFAFDYTDEHRDELKAKRSTGELLSYLKRQGLLEKFAIYAEKNGLQRRNLMLQKSQRLFEKYIYSRIIYNMLDECSWMEYLNEDDPAIRTAKEVFRKGAAFPQKEESQKVAISPTRGTGGDKHLMRMERWMAVSREA